MSDEQDGKRGFVDRLQEVYRIEIIDAEDLRSVGQYLFSMRKLYALIAATILLIASIVVLLIAFTPLRRLMPGYGKIEENREFIQLREEIKVLEKELDDQMTYTQGLQNLLSGDTTAIEKNTEEAASASVNPDKNALPATKDRDAATARRNRQLNSAYFVPPITGTISAGYDRAIGHLGIDVIASKDTPVKAASGGVVIRSGFDMDSGNTLVIQHANDLITVYGHNSVLLKQIGDPVLAGEAVAIIGNTGELTDGPHLHFEVWFSGVPVDPEDFFSFE